MEFVMEILVTVSVSIVLSFLVAKLLSMNRGGAAGGGVVEVKSCGEFIGAEFGGGIEEMKFGVERSRVGGLENETRVDEFELGESSDVVVDRESELSRVGGMFVEECTEVDENLLMEVQSDAVELPESLPVGNSGEEDVVMDRVCEMNVEETSRREEPEVSELPENFPTCDSGEKEVKQDEIDVESNVSDVVNNSRDDVGGEESIDGDEDDWEGIERSELENNFAAAAAFVAGVEKDGTLLTSVGSDVQMQLYGLGKIATEGPCYEPQPMALMMSARAKWNAWQRQGSMSPEVAMEQYIALLSDTIPGWMEDNVIVENAIGKKAGVNLVIHPDSNALLPDQANITKCHSELDQKFETTATGSSTAASGKVVNK